MPPSNVPATFRTAIAAREYADAVRPNAATFVMPRGQNYGVLVVTQPGVAGWLTWPLNGKKPKRTAR